MQRFPIHYIEPVFRPPSEAHSLILPVTNGCSWNQCTYCEMYTAPQKKFRARDEQEVLEEIRRCGESLIAQRVFLADGDAWYCRPTACCASWRPFVPTCQRSSG